MAVSKEIKEEFQSLMERIVNDDNQFYLICFYKKDNNDMVLKVVLTNNMPKLEVISLLEIEKIELVGKVKPEIGFSK